MFDYAQAAPGGGSALAPWISAAGALVVALVAGAFALVQSRRTVNAQQQLERERLRAAEQAATLAQERAEHVEERTRAETHRREQVLPFLEKLHSVLDASYLAAYIPDHFVDLAAHFPQIRSHADGGMRKWYRSISVLSRYRMQLFLALDSASSVRVAGRFEEFAEQMRTVLEVRQALWFGKSSRSDLWEAQRKYVEIGFSIACSIMDALDASAGSTAPELRTERSALAGQLSGALEKMSAATVPYGGYRDFTWIALWEVDPRPEWQEFLTGMRQATLEEFESALTDLARSLDHREDVIEMRLIRIRREADNRLDVWCLSAKFVSEVELTSFGTDTLPGIRKLFPVLWYSFRQPVELAIGQGS